jgi:pre-mRNA-splicing factor RBM22/SLT11
MPPQIKQDLNRSGWETTDFPSVCEKCLPDNPYVQMLKEDHGAVSAYGLRGDRDSYTFVC